MDAHFLRELCRELCPRLATMRLGKIYSPLTDVWSIGLQASGGGEKLFLLLRRAGPGAAGPADGLLFLTATPPDNPATPSAQAMWFRKRASGRRIVDCLCDWPNRRVALDLSPRKDRDPSAGRYLLLDLEAGPSLAEDLPAGFGDVPGWPDWAAVRSDPGVWRRYPLANPPLRRVLQALPEPEGRALLDRLRSGGGPARVYSGPSGPDELLAWPLPESLRRGREERVPGSASEAATLYGEAVLYAQAGAEDGRGEADADKIRKRRLKKGLARIEEDLHRLAGLAGLAVPAEAIRASLHLLAGQAKVSGTRVLEHPVLGPVEVEFDPRLTPVGNMERLFRLAAKGKRGLPLVQARKAAYLDGLGADGEGSGPAGAIASGRRDGRAATALAAGAQPEAGLPKRFKGLAVHLYRTGDGFLVVRGRNAKANHDLLGRAASPFDLWFHVLDGPGAHVVLKRDYPQQEVPEASRRQAAVLAGLSSYRAGDAKGEVICAEVRDVRKTKGAPHGQVKVDKSETILVELDPGLESRLRLAGGQ